MIRHSINIENMKVMIMSLYIYSVALYVHNTGKQNLVEFFTDSF